MARADLCVDPVQVIVDGSCRQDEPVGDLPVGESFGGERRYLELAIGEHCSRRGLDEARATGPSHMAARVAARVAAARAERCKPAAAPARTP